MARAAAQSSPEAKAITKGGNLEAIQHITEAALTDDPEKAEQEIKAAHERLNRMLEAIKQREGDDAQAEE